MTLSFKQLWVTVSVLAGIAFIAFLVPFFAIHEGLPTGDSQKSIIWAQQILQTKSLPDYQTAIPFLNRDPVDFYTPALHVLTAIFLKLGGLPAVGISSLIFVVLTASAAAAIAYHVIPPPSRTLSAILAFILVLTQERFLRYVREPGYHYQNIVGELLLFTLLLLGLHLLERWRWSVFLGMVVSAALLILTHQFSAFLAVFAAFPLVVTLAFRYRRAATILIPFVAVFLLVAIPLGLHQKIPHIFTATPHLLSQTPSLARALNLMGTSWMIAGIAGLLLVAKSLQGNLIRIAFFASTVVLVALAQGPRLGIDIPPIRALFYLAVPLSITGAFFLTRLWQVSFSDKSAQATWLARVAVIVFLITLAGQSTAKAFTLSHTVRTNSTLTPSQLEMAEYLKSKSGAAVLVDDYNRRSTSWLVLSGHPMYTRIAADLETQMNEARQSPRRYQLYLNQLDFEKIFSLGSLPEITQLMEKQNIAWVTGIDGSSASHFSHNPDLQEVKKVDDITLYQLRNTPEVALADSSGVAQRGSEPANTPGESPSVTLAGESSGRPELTQWLLRPSTLANDIGDLEDTFEHLPASLRATRLSEPQISDNTTFRTTSAPLIPLKFNVGDYVRVLWDQDKNNKVDASLELLIQFVNSAPVIQKVSPENLPIDENGFITFTIKNPSQQTLSFDLIALGLAHTP